MLFQFLQESGWKSLLGQVVDLIAKRDLAGPPRAHRSPRAHRWERRTHSTALIWIVLVFDWFEFNPGFFQREWLTFWNRATAIVLQNQGTWDVRFPSSRRKIQILSSYQKCNHRGSSWSLEPNTVVQVYSQRRTSSIGVWIWINHSCQEGDFKFEIQISNLDADRNEKGSLSSFKSFLFEFGASFLNSNESHKHAREVIEWQLRQYQYRYGTRRYSVSFGCYSS
jgi:hypothetical protein